jgi:putative SOS response-associated peptidase YedK
VPVDGVSVVVTIEAIDGLDDLADRIAAIASRREQAASLDRQATREAAELAKALADLDIPLRDVGTVLGVSHQRAHQLVQG